MNAGATGRSLKISAGSNLKAMYFSIAFDPSCKLYHPGDSYNGSSYEVRASAAGGICRLLHRLAEAAGPLPSRQLALLGPRWPLAEGNLMSLLLPPLLPAA